MDDSIKHYKPPNVLIFSPLPSTDGSSRDFNVIKHDVQSCLGLHHYVIYPLTDIDQPWKDNCSLLIIPSSTIITPHDWNEISSYLTSGGKCLSINQQINDSFDFSSTANTDDVIKIVPSSSDDDIDDSHYYTVPISHHESYQSVLPIIDDTIASSDLANDGSDSCIKMLSSDKFKFVIVLSNVHLFSPQTYSSNKGLDCVAKIKESAPSRYHFITSTLTRMGLTCDDGHVPHLTHLYAITHNDRLVDELISSLHSYSGGHESSILVVGEMSSSLFILDDFNIGTPVDPIPPTTDAQVTILVKPSLCDVTSLDFDGECYFSSLTSVKLGRILLVGPVMTSSQTMFSGNIPLNDILSNDMGLVCTPGQQTKGKGRGGNVWLSPKGCMMFSCPLKFPVLSNISKKASIIQHIVALSVVTAIRTIPGYEDVPFNIKWPNDIYYKKLVKLGGVLVTSYTLDNIITIIIGCGVNVCNQYPTLSVNDCISLYNNDNGTRLSPLKLETLLALTLSKLEMYINLFDEWGLSAIESLYYQYWMHHDERVQLSGHPDVVSGTITGIDEFGYLRVITDTNESLTLHPDGNTFDIMKGLISSK